MNRVYILTLSVLIATPVFVRVGNNDFWEHAKVGEWTLHHQTAPKENLFMFTTPRYPWVAHTWLSGVVLCLFHRLGQIPAVQLCEYFCVLISFLILWKLAAQLGVPSPYAFVAFVLAIGSAWFRFQPRPELFSAVAMSCLLYLLCTYKAGMRTNLWFLPPIFLLWANFHGGVVTGLIVLGVFTADEAVWFLSFHRQQSERFRCLRHLGLIFLLSAAATLFNPYGIEYYRSVSPARIAMLRQYIAEWRPLAEFFPLINLPSRLVMGLFVVAVVLSFFSRFCSRRFAVTNMPCKGVSGAGLSPFVLSSFLLTALVVYITPQSVRHLWISAQLLLTVYLANLSGNIPTPGTSRTTERYLSGAGFFLAGFVMLTTIYTTISTGQQFGCGIDHSNTPVGLAHFIESHSLYGRFYNSLGNSNYLTWRLYPHQKVFIDSLNAYDSSIILASRRILRDPKGADNAAKQWSLDGFITFDEEGASPLALWLSHNPRYALVYWDGGTQLFIRRTPQHAALIRKREYLFANPSLLNTSIPASATARFRAEVERARSNPVKSSVLYVMTGNLFLQIDDVKNAEKSFRDALKWNTFDLRAQLGLGVCAFHQGKYEIAIRQCRLVLFLRPQTAAARRLLELACKAKQHG